MLNRVLRHLIWASLPFTVCNTASAAQLTPVTAGLWQVNSKASFDPDPQPGAATWPFRPDKPRQRDYKVCLSATRALVPMPPPQVPGGEQPVIVDDKTLSLSVNVSSARGERVEWMYRRMDERSFEGQWTLSTRGNTMTVGYTARFVDTDCRGVPPSAATKFGEP